MSAMFFCHCHMFLGSGRRQRPTLRLESQSHHRGGHEARSGRAIAPSWSFLHPAAPSWSPTWSFGPGGDGEPHRTVPLGA